MSDEIMARLRDIADDKWEGSASPQLCKQAADLIERLQAEKAEMEKDAERYRWLANNPAVPQGEFGIYFAYKSGTTFYTDKESADAFIDAAMEKS